MISLSVTLLISTFHYAILIQAFESAVMFLGELLEVIMGSKTICTIKVPSKVMMMASTYVV